MTVTDERTPDGSGSSHQPDMDLKALPSRRRLARATFGAIVVAALLSLGVVLPAEYGRDPLGTGAVLGLTEMGRIKVALAAEAEAEAVAEAVRASLLLAAPPVPSAADGAATLPTTLPPRERPASSDSARLWRDSVTVTLQPNEGVEYKLAMRQGEYAFYEWATDSTIVNFNLHGEPTNPAAGAEEHTYRRGNSQREQGDIVAVFDGLHGWFWRNRSPVPVSIHLWTGGEYLVLQEIK